VGGNNEGAVEKVEILAVARVEVEVELGASLWRCGGAPPFFFSSTS
jgi:hypothetical protein